LRVGFIFGLCVVEEAIKRFLKPITNIVELLLLSVIKNGTYVRNARRCQRMLFCGFIRAFVPYFVLLGSALRNIVLHLIVLLLPVTVGWWACRISSICLHRGLLNSKGSVRWCKVSRNWRRPWRENVACGVVGIPVRIHLARTAPASNLHHLVFELLTIVTLRS